MAGPLVACSQAPAVQDLVCAEGEELFKGNCVDPSRRYEPAESIDKDNVRDYGTSTSLELPAPPKSGFRLVVPGRTLEPGEEVTSCASWELPELQRDLVYAAQIYTTRGLHHSNVISLPVDPEKGANPYPSCHPGASDPFGQIGEAVPDVLFANSTQVGDGEALVFPPRMAYRVHPGWEVVADIHMLNTTSEPIRVEVVYDFFTMPESELEHELAPIVADNRDFKLPAKSEGVASSDCAVFGGTLVSLMPHTHEFATEFRVDLLGFDEQVSNVYLEDGYDFESDIAIYPAGIDLSDTYRLRYSCAYKNTKDEPLKYGLADQEMCILFGYIYPPEKAFAAFQMRGEEKCTSVQVGLFR